MNLLTKGTNMVISGWFGFWIFMAVLLVCDTWLYSRGHETIFWKNKTAKEKELQAAQISKLKAEAEK